MDEKEFRVKITPHCILYEFRVYIFCADLRLGIRNNPVHEEIFFKSKIVFY